MFCEKELCKQIAKQFVDEVQTENVDNVPIVGKKRIYQDKFWIVELDFDVHAIDPWVVILTFKRHPSKVSLWTTKTKYFRLYEDALKFYEEVINEIKFRQCRGDVYV